MELAPEQWLVRVRCYLVCTVQQRLGFPLLCHFWHEPFSKLEGQGGPFAGRRLPLLAWYCREAGNRPRKDAGLKAAQRLQGSLCKDHNVFARLQATFEACGWALGKRSNSGPPADWNLDLLSLMERPMECTLSLWTVHYPTYCPRPSQCPGYNSVIHP